MLRAEHMSLGCIGTEWQMEMYGLPQIIMQYNVKMKRAWAYFKSNLNSDKYRNDFTKLTWI